MYFYAGVESQLLSIIRGTIYSAPIPFLTAAFLVMRYTHQVGAEGGGSTRYEWNSDRAQYWGRTLPVVALIICICGSVIIVHSRSRIPQVFVGPDYCSFYPPRADNGFYYQQVVSIRFYGKETLERFSPVAITYCDDKGPIPNPHRLSYPMTCQVLLKKGGTRDIPCPGILRLALADRNQLLDSFRHRGIDATWEEPKETRVVR